jgi:16S rRNA (uracil1498-N3)-methyltransferase
MKLQRFFVGSTLEADRLNAPIRTPSLELVHQLKNVFRLVTGDEVILFDGSGYDFTARIDGFDKESVSFTITGKSVNTIVSRRETWLFASLVKKDTFEWIAEKATELGVSHIVPVISDRSVKQGLNTERLQKIIREAAEQSGRATLPKLYDILELAECVEKFKDVKSVAWEPSEEKFYREDLEKIQGVYIGPEGGWTEREIDLFINENIPVCSLGPQILRAETAVVAALAQIVF